MSQEPKISVIVPVYNVEKTLRRCLNSILEQTFKDFEVILVDDGSTDNGGAICDEYIKIHSNFRVIHKNNEGLGPTRNAGIAIAKGEYLYHCDSDDWLKPTLLENAYNAIKTSDADVCLFGYDMLVESKEGVKSWGKVTMADGNYTNLEEAKKFFVRNYNNGFSVLCAWNRMYKRSFIIDNQILFPNLRRCQDIAYSFLLFDKVNKLVVLNETLYCYVIQPGTFKGRSFDEMIDIYLQINKMSIDQFKQWGLLDNKQKELLNNRTCESIANYSSYAFVSKYPKDKWINIKKIISNNYISLLYKNYNNIKHSFFMKLFRFAILLKSRKLLFAVCKLHEMKQVKNER